MLRVKGMRKDGEHSPFLPTRSISLPVRRQRYRGMEDGYTIHIQCTYLARGDPDPIPA